MKKRFFLFRDPGTPAAETPDQPENDLSNGQPEATEPAQVPEAHGSDNDGSGSLVD